MTFCIDPLTFQDVEHLESFSIPRGSHLNPNPRGNHHCDVVTSITID